MAVGIANRIKLNNTTYDLNDARVSTGTTLPSSAVSGDIFIQQEDVQYNKGWYYVMHGNICECWARIPMLAYCTTDFCYHRYGWGTITDTDNYTRDYPVTFAEQPLCQINAITKTSSSVWCAVQQTDMGSATEAPRPIIVRGTSGPSGGNEVDVVYYAIGEVE